MRSRPVPEKTVAYSYVRFSHPNQSKGDSLRRQTAAAAAWCKAHGITLDTATTLHDLGKSAFTGAHRKNPDRHALAAFLKLVESGKVPRGSYLVVENLDRLSREDIQPALLLVLNLMQAGVRLVQLKPVEIVFDEKSDTMPVMMMILELSRGHSESAIKSERCGSVWARKKRQAREEGVVITRRLPAWVELRHDGRLTLVPERAAVIRKIFALAAAGHGMKAIIKQLTEQKVPAWGRRGLWQKSYLALLMGDRRVLGEFQPCFKNGKADGAPILDYLPRVISQEQWDAVRAGVTARHCQGVARVEKVNVFQKLIHDAKGSGTYTTTRSYSRTGAGNRVLVTSASQTGRGERQSFPFSHFEAAILSLLREVNPHDIVGRKKGADPVVTLSAEREKVAAKIATLEDELADGDDVAAVVRVLRTLEARQRELDEKLAVARREARHPLSEAWGSLVTLLDVVQTAPDPEEIRTRLRSELRRVIERIDLLVVPRGLVRVAALQVRFTGDGHRDYLIVSRPAHRTWAGVADGCWSAGALPPDVSGETGLDLRDPRHVTALESALTAVDLQLLGTLLEGPAAG
jgi:DNA invertase Pin-like site-specific DNA recombinase